MRPQSDGMIERYNRTLEEMLSTFVASHQKNWDEYLPYLTMAYRASVHESTKYSPNRLMLGREINLPIDIVYGKPPNEEVSEEMNYAMKLRNLLEVSHQHARNHLQQSSLRQRKCYDRFSYGSPYHRGDVVWMINPKKKKSRSLKLSLLWDGPYVVIEKLCDVIYKIQKNRRTRPKVVHYDRLKPCLSKKFINWFNDEQSD